MKQPTRGKKSHGLPQHERLHATVAREIGVAIVMGSYQPGDVLVGENGASEVLGVSRPAYREAIRILIAKGLVESRPRTGTRVNPRVRWNLLDPEVLGWIVENGPSQHFLDELFELRLAVEPHVAALAAQRRSAADVNRLRDALDGMRTHAADSVEAEAADRRFHESLVAAAGNELLGQLTSTISISVAYIARQKRTMHAERDSSGDHAALFAAVEQADPEAARQVARRIIARGVKDLRRDR